MQTEMNETNEVTEMNLPETAVRPRLRLPDWLLFALAGLIAAAGTVVLGFFVVMLFQWRMDDFRYPDAYENSGFAVFLSYLVQLPVCGGLTLLSGLGLLLTLLNKKSPLARVQRVVFRWLMAAPWMGMVFYILLNVVLYIH